MSGDLGGHFNNASSSRPVRPIQRCGRCLLRYHLTSLWKWGGAPSFGKWNLGSPLQVVASTNSRACQDTSVPLQFFLQRKMADKASFCIWQQRRSTLENLWHAQWFAEGVLNPRFEHDACWLCRRYGRSPHHWKLSCPQNHHFPGIPTCLHWRQREVVCHFQWVPAQVSACKPWISNACEEHPRLLSGAMLTHGSLSELTSWGCVGRIAELYPLSPPNATDARCFCLCIGNLSPWVVYANA